MVSKAVFVTIQREMKCTFKGFFFNRDFCVFFMDFKIFPEIFMLMKITS